MFHGLRKKPTRPKAKNFSAISNTKIVSTTRSTTRRKPPISAWMVSEVLSPRVTALKMMMPRIVFRTTLVSSHARILPRRVRLSPRSAGGVARASARALSLRSTLTMSQAFTC